jgi:2-polyprenyl-6-methoxyphenol hydroxylase-like FAD-dependent oxidoreductase
MLLEEHMDFDRDFRGDTIHPSVMQIMDEIGLADRLLQIPHSQLYSIPVQTSSGTVTLGDFRHLKTRYPYIAMIPQVYFLEFITTEAKKYPNFQLIMGARVEKLIEENEKICGVHYRGQDGWHEVRALLTVGADGRFSRLRRLAGWEPIKTAQAMDVLWFRLPAKPGDFHQSGGRIAKGHVLILLYRLAPTRTADASTSVQSDVVQEEDYWQIGYVIPKGGYQKIHAAGLEALRRELAELMPEFADRLDYIQAWKQISVLSVESSRLRRWYRPGLLLIGDAAHFMSPVAGVGINYAIQDAVIAANVLSGPLKRSHLEVSDLAAVQRKREWPTRIIQEFQNLIQRRFVSGVLDSDRPVMLPSIVRFLLRIPVLRDLPARFIGLGIWPVHVKGMVIPTRRKQQ